MFGEIKKNNSMVIRPTKNQFISNSNYFGWFLLVILAPTTFYSYFFWDWWLFPVLLLATTLVAIRVLPLPWLDQKPYSSPIGDDESENEDNEDDDVCELCGKKTEGQAECDNCGKPICADCSPLEEANICKNCILEAAKKLGLK